jgi:hypothetical protein
MRPNVCGSSDKSLRDVETPIVLGNGRGRVRLKDGVPKCGVRASLPVRDYPSALLLPDSKSASVIVPEKAPRYHGGNYRRACRDLERDDTLLTAGIGIVPAAWRTSGESSNGRRAKSRSICFVLPAGGTFLFAQSCTISSHFYDDCLSCRCLQYLPRRSLVSLDDNRKLYRPEKAALELA